MRTLRKTLLGRLRELGIAQWEVAELADLHVRTVQRQLYGTSELSARVLAAVVYLCEVSEAEAAAWLRDAARELEETPPTPAQALADGPLRLLCGAREREGANATGARQRGLGRLEDG